jgi:hypothetical protein
MVALLGVMALAIDMGMMYSARNEAQRVADAAALAGASAFLDYHPASAAMTPAHTRAIEYIVNNDILSEPIDTSAATILVSSNKYQVHVDIRRRQISTWFARILGFDTVAVRASATAEAVNAGGAKCVRPWAVQDIWHEVVGGVEQMAGPNDHFGDTNPDRYQAVPVDNFDDPMATGYGSIAHTSTNRDFGSQIQLKAQSPAQNPNTNATEVAQPGPGEFLIWDMPTDPTMVQCAKTKLDYSNEICGCNKTTIELGVPYPLDFGAKVGSTFQGLDALLSQDPNAQWDPGTNSVINSALGANWRNSPRVVPIALMAPLPPPPDGAQNYTAANLSEVTFNNFALFFVESYQKLPGGQPQITGRFMYYAAGEPGQVKGPTVKYLRLVE